MANFNRVILVGNLTRDPDLKILPSGMELCDFGIAMNRKYRTKDGEQKEEVCFVDVTAFGRTAEVINQYMAKGRQILVEGRLKFDSWTTQDGSKRNKLSVVAENVQFLGSGKSDDGGQRRQPSRYEQERGIDFDGGSLDYQGGGGGNGAPPSGDDIPF